MRQWSIGFINLIANDVLTLAATGNTPTPKISGAFGANMTPEKRVRLRKQYLNRARQKRVRKARNTSGFSQLQIRISYYAHAKARLLAAEQNITLTKLYELAINDTNVSDLPRHHLEVTSGDLIGYRPISPWIDKKIHQRFMNEIQPCYPRSRMSLSAIVNAYCDKVNDEAGIE